MMSEPLKRGIQKRYAPATEIFIAMAIGLFSGEALSGSEQLARGQVWDVTQDSSHGEIGSYGDITAALQEGFDTQHSHGLPVFIPAGPWKISKTVVVPFRTGGELIASGMGQAIAPPTWEHKAPLSGKFTRLVWVGEEGGDMFHIQGNSFRFRGGMVLHAKPYKSKGSPPRAARGIVITKAGKKGLASGNHRFESLSFWDFDTAIQHGTKATEHNCDHTEYQWLHFNRCEKGIFGMNSQGIGIYIGFVQSWKTPRTLWWEGGGPVAVEHSLNWDNTLLTLKRNTDNRHNTVGWRNGNFDLRDTRIDRKLSEKFVAVECIDPVPGCHIRFTGLTGSNTNRENSTFAILKGMANLTVRESTFELGKIEGESWKYVGKLRTPNVLLDRCYIVGKHKFVGDLNWRMNDCFDFEGKWVNDR